ncbi:hypothetical protein MMC28_008178 [Mycoblastus sanguinarius]|nr:hypothetical protein [Mycoblastus sanguinarius]
MLLSAASSYLVVIHVALSIFAHSSDIKPQNFPLANDPPSALLSQLDSTGPLQGYPVYPTSCLARRYIPLKYLDRITQDCFYIINEVLLRRDDLLAESGFDYNAFRDQKGGREFSQWRHGWCVINVSSTEANEKTNLQLFNVVLAANKVLQECVMKPKIYQGGTVPIGVPEQHFFVGVLGHREGIADHPSSIASPNVSIAKRSSSQQRGSPPLTETLGPPPGESLNRSSGILLLPLNRSNSISTPPAYPVDCFNHISRKMEPASAESCQIIIDQIILKYSNPMAPQTFGYTDSADIDLSLPENSNWEYGQCVIYVANFDETRVDTFRMVDVAYTAHRIMQQCVVETKYPFGGTADVGTVEDNFYVGLGGVDLPSSKKDTTLSVPLSPG